MKEAFIIMQIGNEELDKIYYEVISPALNTLGLQAKRVDKHNEGQLLKSEIVKFIESSEIIVADLTNERPNCYLEVGYAMGQGKNKNLILTAREDHNPDSLNYKPGGRKIHFDLSGYDILFWHPDDLEEFKKELELRIQRRINNPQTPIKNYPQIYMNFDQGNEPNKYGGSKYPIYRVKFKNEGDKATEKVHGFVLIGSEDKIDIKPHGGYTADLNELDTGKHDLKDIIQCENIQVFQFIFPDTNMRIDNILPYTTHSRGYLAILEKDLDKIKKIIVLNIEDKGFVRQEFKVSKDTKDFEEIKREFNPY